MEDFEAKEKIWYHRYSYRYLLIKIWIVPEKASFYEHERGGRFVVEK
jgi:hypothetical protein